MEQRSTSKSISDDPIVGVVGAPHGVRGEVKVHPRTDVADRFRKGSRLLCDGMGELVVASVRGAVWKSSRTSFMSDTFSSRCP